jgi:Mat/Ecp fimbriae outer membrane usher protein
VFRLIRRAALLPALVAASAPAAGAAHEAFSLQSVGVPAGFADLATPRQAFVDVYFGARKIGETKIESWPGYLRFANPDAIARLIPNAKLSSELTDALSDDLPANEDRACPKGVSKGCGLLAPNLVGVIFDQDRFRVDLFLNPQLLELSNAADDLYLPTPTAPLSLTSSIGFALSGSSTTNPVYNVQNRSVVAFRNARVRTDSSYARGFGSVIDNAVVELDRPGFRYSAGLFWAPGLDLTGQRRILGVGVATQLDTRADRDEIRGTPLVLFLSQPARVELFIDGRLVGSAVYEAGNNVIDTSTLPDGSYEIVLRVNEVNGAVREERRFFAKNAQVAPVGQPLYFAYAGMLANTRRHRPVSVSNDLFYQVGTARRLSDAIAVDVSFTGTPNRPLVEAGGWFLSRFGRMRAAALVSPSGDHGAILQLLSGQAGPLAVNFDLRRIWSHNNTPLVPLSNHINTFRADDIVDSNIANGSYTQISGSIGYRFGSAYLAVTGSFRKDGDGSDFNVGPNFNWPLVTRHALQISFQADAQVTRKTTAAYVGFRMLFTSAGLSLFSTGGRRAFSDRTAHGSSLRYNGVGSVTAGYSYQDELTQASVQGGLDRDADLTRARASALLYSRFGNARAEISQGIQGDKRTQYSLTMQGGAVLNRDDAMFSGRNLEESALVISVDGASRNTQFDVLVDERSRGRVRSGGRLPLFLQPYRSYKVRLRPVDGAAVWFDSSAREYTLYPGNVQHVHWQAEQLITVFGRALRSNGTPVADAVVTSKRGLGQSDVNGYFQVEVVPNESLSFRTAAGNSCDVALGRLGNNQEFAALGRVICR